MNIYQFLIAVRHEGANLTSADGETTSHLMGIFYRTIRMVENGIRPLYVFDGKPPELKSGELSKRKERREEAAKELAKAEELGEKEEIYKFSRRLVKVTSHHNDECKKLLGLMGIPYVEAPCEAEAQCAELVKKGNVYGTATEDMDALTFGSKIVLRHMTFSEARKMPFKEFNLDKVLKGLELTHDQFVDLCILLGCDYTDSIRGVGPKRVIELIRTHKSIEAVLKALDAKKYPPPEDWNFEGARRLFHELDVTKAEDLDFKWEEPNEEELVKYMCEEKGFNEERIRAGAKKLSKASRGTTQGRIDGFFTVKSVTPKRKAEEPAKGSKGAKKGKGSWRGRPK
ncbi:unnamed protein product [Cyprideis torosa]|uniref:Flap endonuclease 1 n=2 Tax=Cyprideis torosa TaxID=163714 RepID=A0A7R8ZS50_9CRUS|nr:unnamed protein product [Cyprideis torosa]CAG0894692.1 unnamed protein product [Cyprideis torosa]